MVIGIRREDKNEWEKRVPLIPVHIKELKDKYGIQSIIQPSEIRCFRDYEYRECGAIISEDLTSASSIIGIKEMPSSLFEPEKTYIFFSHTIKGQKHNLPMLKSLMQNKCNLIDYEKIVDNNNVRLIFFGRFAGIAGMIETLYALGQKLKARGFDTPFKNIRQPYQYSSVEEAKAILKEVATEITFTGIPELLSPIIIAFIGYGNVSRGAQEIFDILPHQAIMAREIKNIIPSKNVLYKVVFKEKDLFIRRDGQFNLNEYYNNPEYYFSIFETYIPHISVLVNCIYWAEKYPRLVTKEYLTNGYISQPEHRLQLINDISCDLNGAIEITSRTTTPDNPAYTYFVNENSYKNGIHPDGISILSIDNLPCEFPIESSAEFSNVLKELIPGIVKANFQNKYDDLSLPDPVKRGLLLHKGNLTRDFSYMSNYLTEEIL